MTIAPPHFPPQHTSPSALALPALPLAFPIPSAFPFQISLSISPRRVAFIPLKLALPLLLPPFLLLLPLASANCILMFHSFNVYFHLLLHSAILIELRNFFFVCILNCSLSHSFSLSLSLIAGLLQFLPKSWAAIIPAKPIDTTIMTVSTSNYLNTNFN